MTRRVLFLLSALLLSGAESFGQSQCAGQAQKDVAVEVTSQFAAAGPLGTGVRVWQMTSTSTGTNMPNVDLNLWIPPGVLDSSGSGYYLTGAIGNQTKLWRGDYSNYQMDSVTIPPGTGIAHNRLAFDGTMLSQPGFHTATSPWTEDVIWQSLTTNGSNGKCTLFLITNDQLPYQSQTALSAPIVDPHDTHTPQWHLIPYSMGATDYVRWIYAEAAPGYPTPTGYAPHAFPPYTRQDGCTGFFARLRGVPGGPEAGRWVYYLGNGCNFTGAQQLIVQHAADGGPHGNLSSPEMHIVEAGPCQNSDWSLDGTTVICGVGGGIPTGAFRIGQVFDANGNYICNTSPGNCSATGPGGALQPPFAQFSNIANWCSFGSGANYSSGVIYCSALSSINYPSPPFPSSLSNASSTNPTCQALFSVTTTPPYTVNFITCTNTPLLTTSCSGECTPKARYAYTDSSGGVHIAFTSGWSGKVAQVFEAVVPTQALPVASLAPASLSFGNQNQGTTSAAQTVTVTNSGAGPLAISSVSGSGDFAATSTCPLSPATLAPSGNCMVSVTFTPTATGSRTGTLTITDNANNVPNSQQTVSLGGTGVAPGATSAPPGLTFGNQNVGTASAAQTIAVTNSGTGPLTITGLTASGDFTQTNGCPLSPATLAAGANCPVNVTFAPTTAGSRTGTLTITDNANSVPGSQQTVSLTGTGVAPEASVSPASLSFGNQNVGTTAPAQTLTLSNAGNAALAFSISIAPSVGFNESDACNGSVAASGTCAMNLTFAPISVGAAAATLTIVDNNNNVANSQQMVSLTGTGLAPVASAAPSSLSFGNQNIGTSSAAQIVTLSNTGNAPLAFSVATSAGFTESDTCSGSVSPSGSCALNVSFAPAAIGSQSGTLTITDNTNNVAGSQQTVSLSGTGINNPQPFINGLMPVSAAPGTTNGFTLTVNGTGFVCGAFNGAVCAASASVVNWNGAALATTFVSSTQLTAAVPAANIAAASTASMTVATSNPGPVLRTSNVVFFPITNNTASTITMSRVDMVASTPSSLAVGDFNRDGKLDFAMASPAANMVAVLLGNGDGTFQTPRNLATGNAPVSMAAGDFNGDGKLDLAVVNQTDGTVSILLGNGDGSFQNPRNVVAGSGPVAVATGDFNGDGVLDLAVVNQAANTVSILLGNSDGTFQNPQSLATGNGPVAIAVADFNRDGKLDLAVVNQTDGTVSILLGNGDGTFQGHTDRAVGTKPQALAAGDFNGDGILDLAVANNTGNTVSILLGTGNGSFQNPQNFATGNAPDSVAVGDFNGDGALDLVTANNTDSTVSILLGDGKGNFVLQSSPAVGSAPAAAIAGDFNGDGRLDLITANASGSISILLQAPVATLSPTGVNFPSTGLNTASAPLNVTLTNSGSASLTYAVGITGANSTDFALSSASTCPVSGSLAGGASCTLSITFTPSASGARAASLNITDNAAGSPQTVTLSGTSGGAGASLSPASLSFANQSVGTTSSAQTVTLSNPSSTDLAISLIATSGDFAVAAAGTTCPTSGGNVTAGTSCTVSVTFTPVTAGSRSGTLTFTDNAGGTAGSQQTVNLTGTGLASEAGLSATSLTFGNQNVGTTSAVQTVTLSNTGNAPLAFSVAASASFAESDTCSGSVGAPGSCALNVTFAPTAAGALTGTLTITDNTNNVANSQQTVSLSGTGTTAVASFSGASLTFANQNVGTATAAQTVNLTNTGNGPLTISALASSGDFAQTSSCPLAPATLAAGANCAIAVTFTPTTAGNRTGTLAITDNSNSVAGSQQTVSLTGTGLAPEAGLSVASLTFGNQNVGTTSAAQTVSLSNTGNAPLAFSVAASSGFAESDTCGGSVSAGGSCSLNVTFAPAVTGSQSGTLTITDNTNNVANTQQKITLAGTGTAPAAGISPTSLVFANQTVGTSSASQTVTLSNTGSGALTIASIAIAGTNNTDFAQANTCGSNVNPGANCAVTVTFSPTASGTRAATVTITDNASGSPQSISLTGTGMVPSASVSTPSVTFSAEPQGVTSAPKPVTVTNSSSNGAVLIFTGTTFTGANPGDFAVSSNACTGTLAQGAKCVVNITFTPTGNGTRSAKLTIYDNASGSPQIISLFGGGPDFSISASPASLTVTRGQSVTSTLTITPSNGFNQTVALACTGAPANSSCTISPTPLAMNGTNTQTTTLTITTKSTTPPGTLTLSVAGSVGTTMHTSKITLTVQ